MPKNENQKFKSLIVARILEQLTDENHPMTPKDIEEWMTFHGLPGEKKSILRDINMLMELYDIDIVDEKFGRILNYDYDIQHDDSFYKRGYKMVGRPFDYEEIQVLLECVDNAKFISDKQADILKNKLSSLRSVYEKKELMKIDAFASGRKKTKNNGIVIFMTAINNAIKHNHKLSFVYSKHVFRDNKIIETKERNGTPIVVSPYKLIINDSYFYLISIDSNTKAIRNFRLDRMDDVKELKAERDNIEDIKSFSASSYMQESFNMYGGKREFVSIRFENSCLQKVVDRFGTKDINIKKEEPKFFYLNTYVIVSDDFFAWLISFRGKAMLYKPKELVEKWVEILQLQQITEHKAVRLIYLEEK